MIYVDSFDLPTETWRRGDVAVSRQAGPIVLEPNFRVSHVTLSGTAVHPDNLRDFEAALTYEYGQGQAAELTIALGKPHEWGSIKEAVVLIRISRAGAVNITDSANHLLQTGKIEAAGERLSVSFRKQAGSLFITTVDGEQRIVLPEAAGQRGGYLTIEATGDARIYLHQFELTTPYDRAPLTEIERRADIDAWLRWRMDENSVALDRITADIAGGVGQQYRTDLTISRGLVNLNEKVQLTFKVQGKLPSPCRATIEPDYLGAGLQSDGVDFNWQAMNDGWRADVELVASQAGNWRVVWQVGDERLSRAFAVIEPGYAVCTLWVGSNFPDIDAEIHRFDLPGDYWVGDWWSPYDHTTADVLAYLSPYASMRHRYGDRLVPFMNATWAMPDIPNFNLMDLDAGLQAEALQMARSLWKILSVGPLEILGSYTLGHDTPRIAAELGIKAINSLCTWQNWLDGSDENQWRINHLAAPNAPYYVADDDFRKVAPGSSIVAFSMGTGTSARNYCVFTMEGCPTLTCPMRRYKGGISQSVNMTRFYDAVDLWLNDASYQPEPLFFTIGLENFVNSPDWQRANALAVEYLVTQAQSHPLVFASAADIADYYHRHYQRQPEHIYYQPDVYVGYRAQNKPAQLPDRIEVSNVRFHTLHLDGQPLPQFFWDFTTPWSEPEWGPSSQFRNLQGLITPEQITEENCVPKQVSLSGIGVETAVEINGSEVEVTLRFHLSKPLEFLPVAVWRLPLLGTNVRTIGGSAETRWMSVIDGATGNLHGIIVCDQLPAGDSTRTVRLSGTPRASRSAEFSLGDALRGRTLYRDGIPHIYLWRAENVSPGQVMLTLPRGYDVTVRYNDGQTVYPDEQGELAIRLTDDWMYEVPLVIGLSPDELQTLATYQMAL